MFNIKYEKLNEFDALSQEIFDTFNPSILEIGKLENEGKLTQGVAAVFDLEEFTEFCNQIDPHLVVPEFLHDFFTWLFKTLAQEFKHSISNEKILLWCRLPFFAKFTGDGVLFLWDTSEMTQEDLGNLVATLYAVCESYKNQFIKDADKKFAKVPLRLRCGIARGQIIAIGDGRDFVGACINVASRLQKLGNLSFAFSKRGFDLEKQFKESWKNTFILVQAKVRGIGEKDRVYVLRSEYEHLSKDQKDAL